MDNSNISNKSNLHVSFFSPSTICTIISLHNAVTRKPEIKGRQSEFIGGVGDFKVLDFLIDKIVEQSTSSGPLTLTEYESSILRVLNDRDLVVRLQTVLHAITDLNSFYKILYRTIQQLKEIKMNKTDNSSIIDIFLRRLAAYFQKLSFKQIISLYHLFMEFKNGKETNPLLNQFIVGYQLQQLKFNIENYSKDLHYEIMNNKIHELMPNDKHNRSQYLYGMNEIIGMKQPKGLDSIYRFFDKEFSSLFQQKMQGGIQTNTINHSVLSIAFAQLKLGFLDEAVKGINEGLRLSQNNSDEESINHCIIYLYQINSAIGKIEEEARLTEHAITHSINLNNVLLMIFSCLNYSQLEKHYDCHKENNILSARNIQWTDALHFARKKLYSNFQNTCKGLYHFQRNLIIPLFLHKMAILNHVPDLKQIFLQGIYNLPHVRSLDHAKLFLKNSKVQSLISNARLCYYRNQTFTYSNIIKQIQKQLKLSTDLQQLTKFWNFKNEIFIERNLINQALNSISGLLAYCKQKDFKKHEYVQCLLQLAKVHKLNGRYYETLNVLEEAKNICDSTNGKEDLLEINIQKIDVLLRLENLGEAMIILKRIQQQNSFEKSNAVASKFFLIKSATLFRLVDLIGHNLPQVKTIQQQAQLSQNKGLHHLLKDYNLIKVKCLLQTKLNRFCLNKSSISNVLQYLNKVLSYFSQMRLNYQYTPEASYSIGQKLVNKLQKMLNI